MPRGTLRHDDAAVLLDQLERAVSSLEASSSGSDSATYGSLLRRCGSLRSLQHGCRIHAQLVKHGRLRGDEFLSNLVLRMYGNCSGIDQAAAFFQRMDPRNQFSWNIMLTLYAQAGQIDKAKVFFEEMPQRDVVSWTSMVVAYAKQHQLDQAKQCFDRMPDRNLVSWNSMLCAFAEEGHIETSLELFCAMDLEGVYPDRVTFVAMLDACGKALAMELGIWIHRELVFAGFQSELRVSTALVEMYGRLDMIDEARRVFDDFIHRSDGDAVLWATMLAAYTHKHLSQAKQLFDATPNRFRSSFSWTTMITAYARAGNFHTARYYFDSMPHKHSVVAWNSIITAYAQSGDHHLRRQALHLFRAMDLDGIAPDSITFTAAIDACSSVAEGKIIHSVLRDDRNHLLANFVVQTALVAMYGNFGHLRDAKLCFDQLKHRDVKAWSSMIAACALNGHNSDALHLFLAMQLHGFDPNSVTFVSVLLACSHAGLVGHVYCYFVSLAADYNVDASFDHYMCMVDALARSGKVYEAEELVATMPYEPDAVAWTSLLSASSAAGDANTAGKAAGNVYELDPANAAPYTLLSGISIT